MDFQNFYKEDSGTVHIEATEKTEKRNVNTVGAFDNSCNV